MQNFENSLLSAKALENIRGIFDKNKVLSKLQELEKELSKENFWKDNNNAKKTIKLKKNFEKIFYSY